MPRDRKEIKIDAADWKVAKRLSVETELPMKEIVRRLLDDAWNADAGEVAPSYQQLLSSESGTVK